MIVAIMSDSHDNIWNLRKALDIVKQRNAEMIIHCGDFVAPFMLKELAAPSIPVHGVFGNNDGDQFQLTRLSLTDLQNITLHGLAGEIQADGVPIRFTHYGEMARMAASSGERQLVCYGHSHVYRQDRIGETTLLNPGEIMGKEGNPGFCLFDTRSFLTTRIDLPNRHRHMDHHD